jgi:hypothetical protein
MYGLTTLAKINHQADEAHLILKAHQLQQHHCGTTPQVAPAAERLATMNKILDNAKG